MSPTLETLQAEVLRLSPVSYTHLDLYKRQVYYCADFAIRFSSSKNESFSNTVLSLSNLQKVDDRPFIACLVTPQKNYLHLANSTFLKKISHSSQELRENNIRAVSYTHLDVYKRQLAEWTEADILCP